MKTLLYIFCFVLMDIILPETHHGCHRGDDNGPYRSSHTDDKQNNGPMAIVEIKTTISQDRVVSADGEGKTVINSPATTHLVSRGDTIDMVEVVAVSDEAVFFKSIWMDVYCPEDQKTCKEFIVKYGQTRKFILTGVQDATHSFDITCRQP